MKVHPPCKSLGKKGFNRTELSLRLLTRSRAAVEDRVYLRVLILDGSHSGPLGGIHVSDRVGSVRPSALGDEPARPQNRDRRAPLSANGRPLAPSAVCF